MRLFLLQGSFRSATKSEKKSCIQMRDLLGNKGKRVVVDVSKMRFGQATNIKKEVNIFDYGCKAQSTRAISLHILLWKGKLEIA